MPVKEIPGPESAPEKIKKSKITITTTNLNDRKFLSRILAFLKKNEPFTINISRYFLEYFPEALEKIKAVLFFSKKKISGIITFSPQGTINCFFQKNFHFFLLDSDTNQIWLNELRGKNINMIMGRKDCVIFLEENLKQISGQPVYYFDYYTMKGHIKYRDIKKTLDSGKYGFKALKNNSNDIREYLPLRTEYETEEVMPPGIKQTPEICRKHLSSILKNHDVLVLKSGDKILSTATINAKGFKYWQIGGVYTVPEYRSKGYGEKIISKQILNILKNGKKPTLIVKTGNLPALKLYGKTGFLKSGDFRISYY